MLYKLWTAFPALALMVVFANAAAIDSCSSFKLSNVSNTVVAGRTFYKAGDNVTVVNEYQSVSTNDLPAFCRIELTITTNSTANSSAHTEVWLPDDWNGRFVALGTGGFSGGAAVLDLAFTAAKQGYAGMSTDTGHQANAGDGSWAGPHNDNAIVDYAWRATHLSVLSAKEVIKQYYGKEQKKSYFLGCSGGGRQGFKEVQDFPDDFDGVVIGSPANSLDHILASVAHSALLTLPVNSSRFIDEDIWTNVIHPEVLKQCDALDGVADGILGDPRRCSFRPETLTCLPNQNTSTCLSLDQIDTLHKLYTDYYETNQTYIFGGYYPGGEVGMPTYLFSSQPMPLAIKIAVDAYRYIVTNDTTWDLDRFDFSAVRQAESVLSAQTNANSPNLTAFASAPHSGKIIHYVGWAENFISAGGSVHYYETVHSWMKSHGGADMDTFYRLFPVPGMEHCMGGFGPISFGGSSQAGSGYPALKNDPEHDILAAMVHWVENDVAPETIIGTAYKNNTVAEGVAFTRPICKYPATAIYQGGDVNSATSFKCV
ncbi:feruloyl esterase-like protein [Cristinia sonorae]|uniref:Carboxylic ester hydrolase n=1 Tax=Cristinia sonorae TaxID=1940300 RepID=A0A8K0UP80_9AGAR|nr:feruloyl esterase-like protein [Cristinia sonorae]